MKKMFYIFSFLLFCCISCNNNEETPKSENDVDAVRNFIQSSLYGDYEKAKKYMLNDSTNTEHMNAVERVSLSGDEKRGLAGASINIHDVQRVNDSTTVVIYSNSYKNNWDTLKVVKQSGEWLVDFKYLFNHDMDTLKNSPVNKPDSIQ
ncbi:MAG TPA: hypothetical protein VI461_12640 [Chitinophagaceae bacterium]|nr:hypothetical protein [Chitinophagaceae bacterium]